MSTHFERFQKEYIIKIESREALLRATEFPGDKLFFSKRAMALAAKYYDMKQGGRESVIDDIMVKATTNLIGFLQTDNVQTMADNLALVDMAIKYIGQYKRFVALKQVIGELRMQVDTVLGGYALIVV